ncbi:hypothetical protein F5Y19DRAFT_33731 [Xylariaceae sp. FL1651]|nr:hypothetical protein F5Y19DRAFT_33731 [Xylariaceae sp. FL1651]
MTEYVEARSLAALNQLAANPPQYPKKPTEARQDPLTLYISRVPGTRDIILSTLKPQVKNVTAEDVASSLYYVHFQTPEEDPLVPPNQPWHSPSPRSSEESPRTHIHRKPVPTVPGQASPGTVSISSAAPIGKENQGHGVPTRKPIPEIGSGGTPGDRLPTLTVMPPTAPVYRKPLGPRPVISESAEIGNPLLTDVHHPLFHGSNLEDQPPPLPTRARDRCPPVDLTEASSLAPSIGSSPVSPPTKRRPFSPFSLILIRRDPSSGQQWNVGKIASFQLENPELIDEAKHHQPSPSVQIHLETSGYAKFRGMPAGSEVGLRGSLDLRPGSSSSATKLQLPDIPTGMPASGAFERQVKMAYSPSFTANLRQRFRSRSLVDEGRPSSPVQRPGHDRHGSQASIGSFGGDFDGSDAPVITQPAPGLKPRGYIFYSPWNGRCEFVTGNAGRSLKCRHILPTYGAGLYNPLVEGTHGEHGAEKAENTQPISELRFNLPTNELFTDKRSPEGGVRARDQIQSQFNRIMAKAQGLEDSDEDDLHFALSLGREKAGGGNRGKRAKMGKLIIFDEGLKMLDLVVAANVGVWWITWERTY